MTDNFLYSAETEEGTYTNVVTAEDLNYIAIDLGYADYSRFPEEPPQSAVSALNQITQDLTSKGILQIGSCCSVSLSEDKIIVADGVCVFENGAKKRILTPQTLDKIADGTNYIYLLNSEAANKIELICSIELPSEESDYVLLAEIVDDDVTDKRYWSISKVGGGLNIVNEYTEKFEFKPQFYNGSEYIQQYTDYEYDIPFGANYFIVNASEYLSSYPIALHLKEGEALEWIYDRRYANYYFSFLKEGRKLKIRTFNRTGNKENSVATRYLTLNYVIV